MSVAAAIAVLIAISSSSLNLSSLPRPCRAATAMAERFGYPRLIAQVNCGCHPHRITGPSSLEGLVEITTPAAALEYVRFFSSEPTYNLFDFGGLVEIGGFGTDRLTEDGRYLISIDYKTVFAHLYHPPILIDDDSGKVGGVRTFRVRRVVVSTDGRVYDVDERVSASGAYAVVSRVTLLEKSTDIGLMHVGAV